MKKINPQSKQEVEAKGIRRVGKLLGMADNEIETDCLNLHESAQVQWICRETK